MCVSIYLFRSVGLWVLDYLLSLFVITCVPRGYREYRSHDRAPSRDSGVSLFGSICAWNDPSVTDRTGTAKTGRPSIATTRFHARVRARARKRDRNVDKMRTFGLLFPTERMN